MSEYDRPLTRLVGQELSLRQIDMIAGADGEQQTEPDTTTWTWDPVNQVKIRSD
jgi:hypothetical protein